MLVSQGNPKRRSADGGAQDRHYINPIAFMEERMM